MNINLAKISLQKLKHAAWLLFALVFFNSAYADHDNMYISYFSPANVKSLATYGNTEKVGGYIMWEISGDMPSGDEHSLLDALKNGAPKASIMTYWTDWGVYTTDRARSISTYGITGSVDADGNAVKNDDMDAKLKNVDVLAYAFLEAVPAASTVEGAKPGTIYFNDPWSDLSPKNSFCSDLSNKYICEYAFLKDGKEPGSLMGNFEAFANLDSTHAGLKRVISIGGYGHDNAFEGIMDNKDYVKNFIDSAEKIIDHYKLDGIDLDYENPSMSPEQSQDFANLVEALHQALPNKIVAVTMLASPTYIKNNFAPDTLKKIADNANRVNLMTYDFHGAFDYSKGGPNNYTGFLTNLYLHTSPADPFSEEARFSVKTSLEALEDAGVPVAKISLGIPAYGRALDNIEAGQNAGLFSSITATSALVPGDLDPKGCSTELPINANACSGSFTYHYIVKHLLAEGLSETIWSENGASNGTTAHGNWMPVSFKLEVTNTGTEKARDLGLSSVSFTPTHGNSLEYKDYLAPGGYAILGPDTNYPTNSLVNQSVTASWSTYEGGPTGICKGSFEFKQAYHVMIKVNNQGVGVCEFKSPSGS